MPDLTGIKIEPQTVAQLSTHQNIIGIKDSSADMTGFRETVRLTADDFAVLVGNGTVLLDGLSVGGCGGVLAVGCVAAALCVGIYRSTQVGDEKTAAIMQEKLSAACAGRNEALRYQRSQSCSGHGWLCGRSRARAAEARKRSSSTGNRRTAWRPPTR